MRAARREDGLYQLTDYGPLDGMGLIYDQAFVLLALASHHTAFGGDPALEAEAAALVDRLAAFAHPLGGYREAPGLEAPLFANPNMHLFEAFQAWARTSSDPRWASRWRRRRRGWRWTRSDAATRRCSRRCYDADWRPRRARASGRARPSL